MNRIVALIALVLAPAALMTADTAVRVSPLFTISYAPLSVGAADHHDIVVTERYAFFATDGGLFRAPLPLGSGAPQLVAFDATPVVAIARDGGTLYAAPDVSNAGSTTTHSLLRSVDEGETWTAIDAALEECHGGTCQRLVSSQIEAGEGRLFVNAGGNVLVSGDDGATWQILFGASSNGKPQAQACYEPAFTRIGQRLLMGGECPLDTAYLRTGTLRADLLAWDQPAVSAVAPPLGNRNVQFIRAHGDEGLVFAGIEGALLRSDDSGESYRYVLHYELDAEKYPYITQIVLDDDQPAIVIGGFNKAGGGPFLAISNDGGETWRDHSRVLPGLADEAWLLTGLQQTADGRVIVAVKNITAGQLHVSELFVQKGKQRAVRH